DPTALRGGVYSSTQRRYLWDTTRENFPALYAVVEREARAVGTPSIGILLTEGGTSPASYFPNMNGRPVVAFNIDFLNRGRFEDVQTWLRHELGHHVQRSGPGEAATRAPRHRHSAEYSADLFAACQSGNVDDVIRTLRNTVYGY